jgi:hypothetical protein
VLKLLLLKSCITCIRVIVCLLKEIKGELKRIHGYGCRCNERRKAKTEGSKRLGYTQMCLGGRGYLKIETMLKGERFESVRGECVIRRCSRVINIGILTNVVILTKYHYPFLV